MINSILSSLMHMLVVLLQFGLIAAAVYVILLLRRHVLAIEAIRNKIEQYLSLKS